jgi:hypothetical protein
MSKEIPIAEVIAEKDDAITFTELFIEEGHHDITGLKFSIKSQEELIIVDNLQVSRCSSKLLNNCVTILLHSLILNKNKKISDPIM